jgi:hypothetical protein
MPFKIIKIQNDSTPDGEYVLLEATGDNNNLDGYAIVDKPFTNTGEESNKFRHIFRFPAKVIPKGDLVSLRTGCGRPKVVKNENDTIVHRYYWNSDECVWNDFGDEAILIKYEIKSRMEISK